MNENDYVRMGAYHTLDIEGRPSQTIGGYGERMADKGIANRDFRLTKAQGWDSVALERIEESTKEGRGAELGAIVCGEGEPMIMPDRISC